MQKRASVESADLAFAWALDSKKNQRVGTGL